MGIFDKLGREKDECTKSKYKVYLIAYKNLDEKSTGRVAKHFISFIDNLDDIFTTPYMGAKGSSGLDFRISIYHKEFEKKIIEKLEEGYLLGIIEMELEYINTQGKILERLSDEFGEDVDIVGEMEL